MNLNNFSPAVHLNLIYQNDLSPNIRQQGIKWIQNNLLTQIIIRVLKFYRFLGNIKFSFDLQFV